MWFIKKKWSFHEANRSKTPITLTNNFLVSVIKTLSLIIFLWYKNNIEMEDLRSWMADWRFCPCKLLTSEFRKSLTGVSADKEENGWHNTCR